MNHDFLKQLQDHTYVRLKEEGADALDPVRRAELLADARERRLLTMINEAVYFGTIKAHLTLAAIGVVAWLIVVKVFLS